ncbi:MAG: hypothetical protein EB015_17535 [Methylocystaceae bacterium]|nr:hypothetical protein [Methylocystaceae bacterium]
MISCTFPQDFGAPFILFITAVPIAFGVARTRNAFYSLRRHPIGPTYLKAEHRCKPTTRIVSNKTDHAATPASINFHIHYSAIITHAIALRVLADLHNHPTERPRGMFKSAHKSALYTIPNESFLTLFRSYIFLFFILDLQRPF